MSIQITTFSKLSKERYIIKNAAYVVNLSLANNYRHSLNIIYITIKKAKSVKFTTTQIGIYLSTRFNLEDKNLLNKLYNNIIVVIAIFITSAKYIKLRLNLLRAKKAFTEL